MDRSTAISSEQAGRTKPGPRRIDWQRLAAEMRTGSSGNQREATGSSGKKREATGTRRRDNGGGPAKGPGRTEGGTDAWVFGPGHPQPRRRDSGGGSSERAQTDGGRDGRPGFWTRASPATAETSRARTASHARTQRTQRTQRKRNRNRFPGKVVV